MATPELRQHWRELEAMFHKLLDEASFTLPEPTARYIREFIDHNEFGEAYHLMTHVLLEEKIAVNAAELDSIEAIGKEMHYPRSQWEGITIKPEAVG